MQIKNLLTGEILEVSLAQWINLKTEIVTATEAKTAQGVAVGTPKYAKANPPQITLKTTQSDPTPAKTTNTIQQQKPPKKGCGCGK